MKEANAYEDNVIVIDEDYKNMEKLYRYIEKLSRQDLMALLKWEVQNRLFLEERLRELEAENDE